MEGHEILGFGFFVTGLWHFFNHIKLHFLSSSFNSYTSTLWFPSKLTRYMELYLTIASGILFIAMELFIYSLHHQPFDPIDGTIPSNRLHNFEHSSMALSFLSYATFSIILDRKITIAKKTQNELTHLLAAIAFAQQFLLFHLHSRDHMGLEGQYHYFLQVLIFICFVTTLMGIGFPTSFLVCFVRSVGIIFQGLWLMFMGFMLFTPGYQPKGCFMKPEGDQYVVRCSDEEALHRAVSLVNIHFSWFLIGVTVFAMSFYLIMALCYGGKTVEYVSLMKEEHYQDEDGLKNFNVESQCQNIATSNEEQT
ncbi:unnamed protein product [Lathyrus oleraceus]|uniref:uncharacterized protein LOC127096439 n=1 Tax=Pisum sativum TaxID=3888 RepID=UPI0021D35FC1|nr:uncharacterized protein LOC127096439 [Pisum sativum]